MWHLILDARRSQPILYLGPASLLYCVSFYTGFKPIQVVRNLLSQLELCSWKRPTNIVPQTYPSIITSFISGCRTMHIMPNSPAVSSSPASRR